VCLVVGGFALSAHSAGAGTGAGSLAVSVAGADPTGRIAAGDAHTCAIATTGRIWCWGDNDAGKLGDPGFAGVDSLVPRLSAALPGGRVANTIAAGRNHTCVLANDGTVWCWGENALGQLGIAAASASTPTQVVLGQGVLTLGAGGNTTCAELADGTARCWGSNTAGQWGDGTTSGVAAPGSHGTVTGVRATPGAGEFSAAGFSAGLIHVCATAAAGTVWCWGQATNGRLGSSSVSNALTPRGTAALGAGTAVQVASGHEHSCAVMSGGALACWGRNDRGQIGRDPVAVPDSGAPTAVAGLAAVRAAGGAKFTCVATTAGAARCFGLDNTGQLGDGAGDSSGATPRAVSGITGTVVDVVAGSAHACAVTDTGSVWCWGYNATGQLGANTSDTSMVAVAVGGLAVNPSTTTTTTTTIRSPAGAPESTTTSSTSSSTVARAGGGTTSTVAVVSGSPASTATEKGILTVRLGRSLTAARLAGAVGMAIPRRSQGTMRISISTGRRTCVFEGSSIRGARRGSCTVAVLLRPVRGRSILRTLTVRVR